MVRKTTICFFLLIFAFCQGAAAEMVWQPSNSGIGDLDTRSISVFSAGENLICAASLKNVYLSKDQAKTWQNIFSLDSKTDEINFVTFDSYSREALYAATTKGLFATKDQGKTWQRIFQALDEQAKNVNWVAIDSSDSRIIYLGADDGVYASLDLGVSWKKVRGGLSSSQVSSLLVHPTNCQVLYLVNTLGLFKSIDRGESWKRIYVSSYKMLDENATDSEDDLAISENQNLIRCIAICGLNPKRIYLATAESVFVSVDAGESWDSLPAQGLSCDYVNFIVVSKAKDGAVFAATENGVFEFLSELNRWEKLYQGMTAREVYHLAFNEKQLFAATDQGVFRTIDVNYAQGQRERQVQKEDKTELQSILNELALNEPTIQQVQEAALRYAEVIHPRKIRALRRDARLKALLPTVRVAYDKTVSVSTNPNYKERVVGPRDWGLTLSWDVGDLVFSEQIRLIDSNTRLMVQLRDDILDEITRLYYERRKLQTEVLLSSAKAPEENLANVLRLEELSANIDALTGGYFSNQLNSEELRKKSEAKY